MSNDGTPAPAPPSSTPTDVPVLSLAVRTLCEFSARCGDLDLRFTPSPTALQGMAGHAEVRSRRNPHYQAEVAVQGSYRQLRLRGRADGYDPQAQRVEEIKTHRGDLATLPANQRALHWAQARVYGWLLCRQLELSRIDVALVYYDIVSQRETVLMETQAAEALQVFCEALCERYLHWAEQEAAHRRARDATLLALAFPYTDFRPGQRQLAEAVYRANASGRCLLAQAPTGIGKTMATLFPALKAMPGQRLDKLFYLTAKTPGRQLALQALARLNAPTAFVTSVDPAASVAPETSVTSATAVTPAKAGVHGGRSLDSRLRGNDDNCLRVLELVARDKACEHPDKACHGESCPLARGFYDRLPQARAAAVQVAALDKQALRALALEHAVCPYYLGQELLRWSDVVVGDFNHFFDLHAGLHALTLADELRASVLVDEAHNLVERARRMYTGELEQHRLSALRRHAPKPLRTSFDRVLRPWRQLLAEQADDYQVHAELPKRLLTALQQHSADLSQWYVDHPAQPEAALQQWHFDVLQFLRLAESHGDHALFDVTRAAARGGSGARAGASGIATAGARAGAGTGAAPPQDGSTLCLRNVVPAPMLRERWAAAHSFTLFSATLSPPQYLRDMLGLPADTAWLDLPPVFGPAQLQVQLAPSLSTRWRDRQRSLDPLVDLIAQTYDQRPGNYLAFFSSFDYLQQAAGRLAERHAALPQWQQSRRMDEAGRDGFLARFHSSGRGIGFAVLGGAFGEGIDLPGTRLIGAFIATLGLPQTNPVNEQMRQRVQACLGQGHDYTYLFPGLQKVVQAAGRVIRTPEDTGVVVLLDDRFARSDVRALLPSWWQIERVAPAAGHSPPTPAFGSGQASSRFVSEAISPSPAGGRGQG